MSSTPGLLEAFPSVTATSVLDSGEHESAAIQCVYCRGSIPAATFTFWSSAKRLLSATCPDCDRRVTLPTAVWRRWLKGAVA
jgi:hypothetical protein